MKRTDLAYMAGIMDGEGYISLARRNSKRNKSGLRYDIQVGVTNTNKWLLETFRFSFGGSISKKRKGYEKSLPSSQDCFNWQIGNQQALTAIKTLLPYLRLKRLQAELAIKFCITLSDSYRSGGVPQEVMVLREAQYILMKKLQEGGKGNDNTNSISTTR